MSIDGETFVFHYVEGILRRKPVALGPRIGDIQVISEGLLEGDYVVARDIAGLSDGQTVEASLGVS